MTDSRDAIPEHSLLEWHAGAPEARAELAARIAADEDARALLTEWRRQDEAIVALYKPRGTDPLPDQLVQRLEEARSQAATFPRRRAAGLHRLVAALALMALGAGLGWAAHGVLVPPPGPGAARLAVDAARAYVTYAPEAIHPVEVSAGQASHLMRWISKRLGHPIAAPDFARAGFRLMGGRIVPSPSGPAALFMYDDATGRRLTLYVAPRGVSRQTGFRFFSADGARGFWWLDRDLSYAVTGTLPREVLRRIAVMAYDQLL